MISADVPPFDPTAPLPDGTMLLEASAGTGKTYTITSLVLRAVAELDLDLERLLVVTFTRAAAAELRGRIRTRLTTAAGMLHERATGGTPTLHDDEVVAYLADSAVDDQEVARRARRLRAAAERFDDATIDTIHGFCQRTLQRAAPDVDLELGAELTEDAGDLLAELVRDTLVAELRDADPDWYRFVTERLGVNRFLEVARVLEQEPDLRLFPPVDEDEGPAPHERWGQTLDRFREAWTSQGQELADWLSEHAGDSQYRGKNLSKRVTVLDDWCRAAIGSRDPEGISTPLKWFCRSHLRERFGDDLLLPDHLDVVDAAEALRSAATDLQTRTLRRFADQVLGELPRRKAARGTLTFTDQLVALDRALADSTTRDAVRAGIRTRFDVALIDEFQDTDPVQWRIFDRVFGGDGALRLIGDPKQAIYGFRGADVHTYLRAKRSVADDAHRTLATNHRSDGRYVQALEQLFGRDGFGPDGVFAVPRITHVPVEAAHADDRLRFPDGPRAPLELVYVPRDLHEEDLDPGELLGVGWARPFLARLTAHEIVRLLSSGATIGTDQPRPVLPRDIAVLVRTNQQAQRVQSALLDVGVPAVVGSDTSVFATSDAVALQRLLDAVVTPSDGRALRAALTGPILGVTPEDLVAHDVDPHLDRFDAWLTRWRTRGVAAMLAQVLADTGAIERLVGEPRGERRLTNLRHLTELLHGAESAGRLGPEGVVAWLREQRQADSETSPDERQLRLESDEDAVTVVTVHRSKGLQYGIVWCPFLWEGRLLRSGQDRVLRFHDPATDELTLDLDADIGGTKAHHVALAERQRWEEDLRLMYVALTRARHRCVVHTGPFKGSGTSPVYRLLHGAAFTTDDAGRPVKPEDPKGRSDEELRAELADLVSDEVALRDADPRDRDLVWTPSSAAPVLLSVRRFDRTLDRSWQRTSFSRLTADEGHQVEVGSPEDDGVDRDQVDVPDAAVELPEEPSVGGAAAPVLGHEIPLAAFPRGPEPGTFLHTLIEHLDFEEAEDLDAVREVIDRHADGVVLAGFGRDALAEALQRIVSTPLGSAPSGPSAPGRDTGEGYPDASSITGGVGDLPADLALADITSADRLDELDFDLPVAGGYRADGEPLTLQRLAEVFASHAAGSAAPLAAFADRLRRRQGPPARGFLTGSIDLVLRVHRGPAGSRDPGTAHHLVVDHKSNWLGSADGTTTRIDDYHPDRLAREMVAHDYVLQYHLYLVAVHRFLRWRLGDVYDYDRHVAGVRYLFLRGMVGPDTPRTPDGGTYGVYADRPERALIEDLDTVLAGGPR
jgi:exodeoxyribonuclease V beta subunit